MYVCPVFTDAYAISSCSRVSYCLLLSTRTTISTKKSRSWLMVLYRPKPTVLSGAALNTDYTFHSGGAVEQTGKPRLLANEIGPKSRLI